MIGAFERGKDAYSFSKRRYWTLYRAGPQTGSARRFIGTTLPLTLGQILAKGHPAPLAAALGQNPCASVLTFAVAIDFRHGVRSLGTFLVPEAYSSSLDRHCEESLGGIQTPSLSPPRAAADEGPQRRLG